MRGKVLEWNWLEAYGRDRDRTDDLYRVKVALIPTELRARGRIHKIVRVGGKGCQHEGKIETGLTGGPISIS